MSSVDRRDIINEVVCPSWSKSAYAGVSSDLTATKISVNNKSVSMQTTHSNLNYDVLFIGATCAI